MDRQEPIGIQTFISEGSVETFNEAVLLRCTRFDEVKINAVLLAPVVLLLACEFRVVIASDPLQFPILDNCLIQELGDQ